jgi:ssDNA-specific exonuclease RecJ
VILIQIVLESRRTRRIFFRFLSSHAYQMQNKVAKDFFENYFLMMFQPYFSVQENFKKNMKLWQEMGWLPPESSSPLIWIC